MFQEYLTETIPWQDASGILEGICSCNCSSTACWGSPYLPTAQNPISAPPSPSVVSQQGWCPPPSLQPCPTHSRALTSQDCLWTHSLFWPQPIPIPMEVLIAWSWGFPWWPLSTARWGASTAHNPWLTRIR